MELCVLFFSSNHANAFKVDTFSWTEIKLKNIHDKWRKMAIFNE